jgi:hypothetical protein
MPKIYKIHPAIGIARVGNSPDGFFIGPEIPDQPSVEIGPGGAETPLQNYKDANQLLKRQAARFRVFEYDQDAAGNLSNPQEITSAKATITWTVKLANLKAAARKSPPPRPTNPFRNLSEPNRAVLAITPPSQSVAGPNLAGPRFDQGQFRGKPVYLGEMRTDAAGRLLVLGGQGASESIPANSPITNFANNDDWHDDVADGPVTATVAFSGQAPIAVKPEHAAWVIVAPPDFAPAIEGITTLYDVAFQAAVTRGWLSPAAPPSFRRDIFPTLQRAAGLRWVHEFTYWNDIPRDGAQLADPSPANKTLRQNAFGLIQTNPLNQLHLTDVQTTALQQWVAGTFVNDWATPLPPPSLNPDGLDRAALEACVGGGFFPGIEAGELLTQANIYVGPFRLDPAARTAGGVTERMAVPWQADFWQCQGDWWPAQRPDNVMLRPDDPAPNAVWASGINSELGMVRDFFRLGVVVPQQNTAGDEVFVESERDPHFPR